jgi:hypothetical protein
MNLATITITVAGHEYHCRRDVLGQWTGKWTGSRSGSSFGSPSGSGTGWFDLGPAWTRLAAKELAEKASSDFWSQMEATSAANQAAKCQPPKS